MSYIYLLNDILFNSQNTNIKYAWIYKELIQNKIPEIFWSMFNDSNVPNIEYLISKVRKVIDIWIEKKYFYDEFFNGILLYVNTPLSESIRNDFESKVKPQLETYEGELLELYTKDETQLQEIAKKNGIYDSLSYPELIELLLKVKERALYEECIRECDGEECDEEMLNMKIDKLKEILTIMRKEYQKLNMLDVDGVEINKAEYEFFGFKCENEDKEIEAENKKEEEYDDDIDGEQIH